MGVIVRDVTILGDKYVAPYFAHSRKAIPHLSTAV